MRGITTAGRGAALCAALALAVLGLTACGDDAAQQEPTAVQEDGGGDGSPATEESGGGSAPSGLTGEALPDDWPAEFLVPDGEVVLVLPLGDGGYYSVLVEGVDDDQARGLIDEMVAGGLSTTAGVTETGGGAWAAEGTSADRSASYAYATGGAGEPNVTIQVLPQG